jgi:hypothetical protein
VIHVGVSLMLALKVTVGKTLIRLGHIAFWDYRALAGTFHEMARTSDARYSSTIIKG